MNINLFNTVCHSTRNRSTLTRYLKDKALKSHGLVFGEMDIYHYMVNLETDSGMTSLFRVANGMTT